MQNMPTKLFNVDVTLASNNQMGTPHNDDNDK